MRVQVIFIKYLIELDICLAFVIWKPSLNWFRKNRNKKERNISSLFQGGKLENGSSENGYKIFSHRRPGYSNGYVNRFSFNALCKETKSAKFHHENVNFFSLALFFSSIRKVLIFVLFFFPFFARFSREIKEQNEIKRIMALFLSRNATVYALNWNIS